MSFRIVALTGATGFIGRHLLKELPKRGFRVRVLLRRPTILPPEASGAVVGDLAVPRNMSDERSTLLDRSVVRGIYRIGWRDLPDANAAEWALLHLRGAPSRIEG